MTLSLMLKNARLADMWLSTVFFVVISANGTDEIHLKKFFQRLSRHPH